ncbi:MAG: two-component system, cell cycle sensor histidine kinase and response regulator CckA [Chthoniobacter sp.]|jgi:CheY-like chemotaxis protein|nr:two-component system, cell cycle sensor histidine kinase and response regulator CckA [Chthoniobacter sp.]
MADPEEQKWVRATANELNNLLQVISNSSQMIETLCPPTPEAERYFAILRSGVDRATQATQLMVNRVGGTTRHHDPAAPAPRTAPSTPESPKPIVTMTPSDVKVHNPMGNRELVMIVDDEDFVTLLAQRVLTDEGYRVVTARDGFQAIETYRKLKDQIALIILDFTMPVMDGSDVFAELLLINPQVPVVLSSGFAEQERLRSMLARGLRGFMPKPYTQQKLLTQIRSTLDALHAEKTGERRIF